VFFLKKKPRKLGLALGGGAARGIAHLGVLKALQDYFVPIFCISAVSSGSIVGGLFSAGIDVNVLISHLEKTKWSDFVGFHISRKGLFSSQPIEDIMRQFIGGMRFKELKIPFIPLATNILTGEGVKLHDPNLEVACAVRASASFPGVFMPYKLGAYYFIDGGAASLIPAFVAREMGAEAVIGVNVIPHVELPKLPLHMAMITDRGLDLLLHVVSQRFYSEVDLMLNPISTYVHSFSLSKASLLMEMGYDSVIKNLEGIKKLVG